MSDARWDRIKSVFEAVMALPADQRAGAVERRCAGDDDLRREVESLVSVRTQAFVRTGGAAEAIGNTTTTSAPIAEKPGEVIGHYKLLQVIGEGGFGTVFLAEQSEPVRRKVAVKIIKLGMDTRAVVARFEAERQALAMMDHPHIARVLDGGATDSGRPYFVMEYVKGDAITAFADAHKLGVRERLELFSQVCAAVQHAHTKGIIHRDLKPGNVLVSTTDGRPFAKVIDFGIAKATGASLTDKTLFTEHRQLIGTPEYMSPEQAEGSPDIDTRTDVYALGVLLYELLTGATPFDAKRLRSAAFGEMQRIIKEEEPLAPSVKVTAFANQKRLDEPRASARGSAASGDHDVVMRPRSKSQGDPLAHARGSSDSVALARALKGELDWIVMKALDKDRARRYESANQMAEDVRRHLGGEAVVAAPPSAAYRVRKFVRRNKVAVLGGGTIAAALVLGVAGTSWQWTRAQSFIARLMDEQQRAAAKVDALTKTIVSMETPSLALPDIGKDMYVESPPTMRWKLHRGRTIEETKITGLDDHGREIPLSISNSVDTLTYFASTAMAGVEASNKDLRSANASLTAQNQKVIESLTQLVHTLNLANPRDWWWYTFPDGRKVTVVREKSKEWNAGVRILEGHVRDPEYALNSPQPPIDPEFALQTLAIAIEDAAIAMENQLSAAHEAGAHLRVLVDQAKDGLIAMMNESSSGRGFLINPPRDTAGGNWFEKVDATGESGRKIRIGSNVSTAAVTMEIARDADGRETLKSVAAEGEGGDRYLLSMLIHNGLAGIRLSKQNEEELRETNQKLSDQIEQAQRQAYRANVGAAATALDSGEPAACRALLDECPEPRRGWEWRALDTRLDDALAMMECDRRCASVQFSPDGARVLWQGSNGVAGVCDAKTGREIARIQVPDSLEWVQFSPDGSLIESLSVKDARAPDELIPQRFESVTVQFWDAASGRETRRIDVPGSQIVGVELSPDRRWMAVLSRNEATRLVPIDGAAPAIVLSDTASDFPRPTRFSPDGRRVLISHFGHSTEVFSTTNGERLLTIGPSESGDARFSPDSSLVVSVNGAGEAAIWNIATGERNTGLRAPEGHRTDGFYSCHARFSPDGKLAATTVTADNAIRVWDTADATERWRLVHSDLVNHAAFSPDGSILITTDSRGSTYVWDLQTGKLRFKLPGESVQGAWTVGREVRTISPDGSRLVTFSHDGRARVWDTARSPGRSDAPAGAEVLAASDGPGGRLVLGGGEHDLCVVDRADLRPILRVPEKWVPLAALTPDGRTLIFQAGYVLRTLDVATGKELDRRDLAIDGVQPELRHLRISADGARAMVLRSAFFRKGSADESSDRCRYDIVTWEMGGPSSGRTATIEGPVACAFEIAPELDRIVAAQERGSLTLFDGSSGRRVAELVATSGAGWAVSAFSRDGAFVSGVRTTAEGPAACLWRASDGSLVWSVALSGLNGGVTSIGFSHDGRLIGGTTWAGQGLGGTAFVLDAADGKLLWRAENPGVSMDALAFTPDGSRLLTCRSGDPAGIDVWDTQDGRRLLSFPYWLAHGSSNDGARPGFATTDECLLVRTPDNSHAVLSSRRARDRATP